MDVNFFFCVYDWRFSFCSECKISSVENRKTLMTQKFLNWESYSIRLTFNLNEEYFSLNDTLPVVVVVNDTSSFHCTCFCNHERCLISKPHFDNKWSICMSFNDLSLILLMICLLIALSSILRSKPWLWFYQLCPWQGCR